MAEKKATMIGMGVGAPALGASSPHSKWLLCLRRSPGYASPGLTCAVERRAFLAGANPARQLSLQPVAARAVYGGNDMD